MLTGNPADPRLAWLSTTTGAGRIDVVFPPGFRARFTPRLEILNDASQMVARDGDVVDEGCVVGPDGSPLLILWR